MRTTASGTPGEIRDIVRLNGPDTRQLSTVGIEPSGPKLLVEPGGDDLISLISQRSFIVCAKIDEGHIVRIRDSAMHIKIIERGRRVGLVVTFSLA